MTNSVRARVCSVRALCVCGGEVWVVVVVVVVVVVCSARRMVVGHSRIGDSVRHPCDGLLLHCAILRAQSLGGRIVDVSHCALCDALLWNGLRHFQHLNDHMEHRDRVIHCALPNTHLRHRAGFCHVLLQSGQKGSLDLKMQPSYQN